MEKFSEEELQGIIDAFQDAISSIIVKSYNRGESPYRKGLDYVKHLIYKEEEVAREFLALKKAKRLREQADKLEASVKGKSHG
jgi:hypothetical protein